MGKASSSRADAATRAERKFEKKLDFYAKVRNTVASLGAQKSISKKKKLRSRQKKLKAYDLSSLAEFLPEPKAPRELEPVKFKLNCKSRQSLVIEEGNRLRTVVSHPTFQSNPMAAIYQHLLSTQPPVDEKPKRRDNKKGKKPKSKRSGSSSGPRSMDV